MLSGPPEILQGSVGGSVRGRERAAQPWGAWGELGWLFRLGYVIFHGLVCLKNKQKKQQKKVATLQELLKGLHRFHKPHAYQLLPSISRLKG